MGNVFGKLFRISTWGESHGGGIGVVIDGCPPGISISEEEIQLELDRRRPGQSAITTQRQEPDAIEILSGVFEGQTTGTSIGMLVRNKDARSGDYDELKRLYRPSHADYTYQAKYGVRNWKGGGRSSARETIGRVAAGALARKILSSWAGIELVAYVLKVQGLVATVDVAKVTPRRGHRVHSVDPVMAVNFPCKHRSHVLPPFVIDANPRGHCAQAAAPVSATHPCGQVSHAWKTLSCAPAGHGLHSLREGFVMWPARHFVQFGVPPVLYVSSGQGVH